MSRPGGTTSARTVFTAPGPRKTQITGDSKRGAIYGALDAAEQIRFGTPWAQIPDLTVKAHFKFRDLKFNLP